MYLEITIMALIGLIIGWFTNFLAIRLIFRPLEPIRIPFTDFKFQGLIPKRRKEIARSIAETVEGELFNQEEMLFRLNTGENQDIVIKNIKIGVLKVIEKRIPAFIPQGLKRILLKHTGDMVEKESRIYMRNNTDKLIADALTAIDIKKIVEERINDFDLEELEAIILSLSRAELRYIELLGGALGFIIGLAQGIFFNLFFG